GKRLVRRVPDEEMTKAEALVFGKGRRSGADELLAHEGREMRLDAVSYGLRRELGDRPSVEHLAFYCAALHHHAHVAVEQIDARLQERLDRRWNDDVLATALAHHREHLLHEERVAGGCNRDAVPQARVQR